MSHEELAIIKDVSFGMRDVGFVNLSFTVEACVYSALQILGKHEALKLINDNKIINIKDLEGKPCIIEVDGGTMKFLRLK